VNQQCHMTPFVKRAVREEELSGIAKGGSGGAGLKRVVVTIYNFMVSLLENKLV